jgi:protoheme IX farnesyltransferase
MRAVGRHRAPDRVGEARRGVLEAGIANAPSTRRQAGVYIRLTKPRIIELLLITTLPTMLVAAGGWPGTGRVVATLLGGALAGGSANAFNCYLERDLDARMARTRQRPLPQGEITARKAAWFATGLGTVGVMILWFGATPLAAVLAALAIVYYAVVYTLWLKPRSTQAVVVGGFAGGMPVLTGWAAVTGGLDAAAPWLLFGVLCAWQPPHFWALATRFREDYGTASLPMLPVVQGPAAAARRSLGYAYLTVALTVGYALLPGAGWLFAGVSAPLLAGWLRRAHRFQRDPSAIQALRMFRYSTVFVAVLFLAAGLDAVVPSPPFN